MHELCSKTLTNNECVAMDSIVKNFLKLPHQRLMTSNSNSLFPRLLWKNGISRLTDITADYKAGMLLTIVVVSLTAEGKRLFEGTLGGVIKAKEMLRSFQN